MLDALRTVVSQNAELVSAISIAIGLASILLAVFLYRAGKPKRLLSYASRTFRIISEKAGKVPGLTIDYDGHPIRALSVTRLAIWNAGNEALKREDIPPMAPLVIYVRPGVSLFDIRLIEVTSPANNVEIIPTDGNSNLYVVNYQYFDPSDGAILSIIHDGTEIGDVAVRGRIVGGYVRRAATDPETMTTVAEPHAATTIVSVESGRSYYRGLAFIIIIGTCAFAAILSFLKGLQSLILGPVGIIAGVLILLYTRRFYPPVRLRKFDDNLETLTSEGKSVSK